MVRLNQFNGGLNVRLASHLLKVNEAVVYTNVDNSEVSLKPVKDDTDEGISVSSFIHNFKDSWISSSTYKTWVEFQEKLYYTDGVGIPQKSTDGISWYNLGIAKPIITPTIMSESPYLTDSIDSGNFPNSDNYYKLVTITEGKPNVIASFMVHVAGDSLVNGVKITSKIRDTKLYIYRKYNGVYRLAGITTYTFFDKVYDIGDKEALYDYVEPGHLPNFYEYCYTFYNSHDGTESMPSEVAGEAIKDYPISISGFGTTDPQVDKIRVYRRGYTLTEMTLVAEIANPGADYFNYSDTLSDLDVDGHILDSYNNGQAPEGLRYLTQHNAMFFGAKADKLYYSEIAYVDNWSPFNFIDFPGTITGLGVSANGLLVFTKFKTYIVTGTSPETLSKYLVHDSVGCVDHRSMQFTNNSLIWLSQDGICVSEGGLITNISKDKFLKTDIPKSVIDSAIYDECYYLAHSNGILVVDFRYGLIFRELDLVVASLHVYNDILYYSKSGKLYSFATASNYRAMQYKSPLILNTPTNKNLIYDFKIDYEGDIHLAFTSYHDDSTATIHKDLSSRFRRLEQIVDINDIVCNSVQVAITGTGKVYDITFEALDKSNIANALKFYATEEFKEIVKVNNQAIEFNKTNDGYKQRLPFVITNLKLFKSVIVTFKGNMNLRLYLNGNKVMDKNINATSISTEQLLIPSSLSRAYYAEIEYAGNGKIYDIEINPLPRQNDGK